MDVNELLNQQRILATRIFAGLCTSEEVERFAEVVSRIDRQLETGGYLPDKWARARARPSLVKTMVQSEAKKIVGRARR